LKLLLATRNPGKIREQASALSACGVEVVGLDDWPDLPSPPEPGPTFLDNAIAKALYYHRATKLPALGEDSGLEVEALGGEPGIHSARWMGEDTSYDIKNAKLIELLASVPPEKRKARFVSTAAIAKDDEILFETVESCEGRIAEAPRGASGFGYDPIFFYPPYARTLGEATDEEKLSVSHRGQAFRAFAAWLARRRWRPRAR
jgi:XTP/dITP diphosphohydrolase